MRGEDACVVGEGDGGDVCVVGRGGNVCVCGGRGTRSYYTASLIPRLLHIWLAYSWSACPNECTCDVTYGRQSLFMASNIVISSNLLNFTNLANLAVEESRLEKGLAKGSNFSEDLSNFL